MNYYKRHLGDYAKKTRTLTVLQHGIYTLLLDLYYSEEAPVTAADAYTVCQARTAKDRAAVDAMLAKFFVADGAVWRNPKADEVIGKYHAKAPKNAENGRLGGLAKAQRNASETLEERQPDADISQKPELSNQKKEKKKSARAPETTMPENFGISERVLAWACAKGYGGELTGHLENFVGQCRAKGYTYADWDEAFMNAVRKDWAQIRSKNGSQTNRKLSLAEESELAARRHFANG